MQTTFNEHLPWSHRLETGPAECAERLNTNGNGDGNGNNNFDNGNKSNSNNNS